jgi:prevent-host-death family protein
MKVSISDAKGLLTDLVRRAEAGEEVVLTRHGHPAARLVPIRKRALGTEGRRPAIEAIRAAAARKATPGPGAAESQDFLYDERGLPR